MKPFRVLNSALPVQVAGGLSCVGRRHQSPRKSLAVAAKNKFLLFAAADYASPDAKARAPDKGGALPAFREPEASGLNYQRSPFSLNCVDVQPHFLRPDEQVTAR